MKAGVDNQANVSMTILFVFFIVIMGLFIFWPKSPGNQTSGYTPDGTAVQSDTIRLPINQRETPSPR